MPRLDPDVAATRSAVRAWLAQEPDPGLVLVACSGGPDSLALAAALAFEARGRGIEAGAIVVDHGLLPDSAAVAERAAQQCRGLGLDPVRVQPVTVASGGGPEGAARTARYRALEAASAELAGPDRPAHVLLGHTADDQAETVLLRLARGSGTRSLAGIPRRRGVFVRPLLGLRRDQLRRACTAQGLVWWEDPTNAADGPLRRSDGGPPPRAAVRALVLPALTEALGADPVPPLARTAELLARDTDLLERLSGRALAQVRLADPDPDRTRADALVVDLDAEALAGEDPALRLRALRTWLLEAGSPPGTLAMSHLDAVDALVTSWHGQQGVDVPGDVRVVRTGEGTGRRDRLRAVRRRALL